MADMNCRECGACCVGQLILVRPDDDVPLHMTDGATMREQFGRCIAFDGLPGKVASCRIYERRPLICRVMKLGSWACTEIRCEILPTIEVAP